MKQAVEQAIEEIRKSVVGHRVDVEADDDGGAFVHVHDLEIGEQYEPDRSWVAFHITFQYPFADVYPHFCGADVNARAARRWGRASGRCSVENQVPIGGGHPGFPSLEPLGFVG